MWAIVCMYVCIYLFMAGPAACGSSLARDQPYATEVTQANAVMPDP